MACNTCNGNDNMCNVYARPDETKKMVSNIKAIDPLKNKNTMHIYFATIQHAAQRPNIPTELKLQYTATY